jgi:hypothetical protein
MNIRRGVFRLWVLFAVGCVARAVYVYFWGPWGPMTTLTATDGSVIQLTWDYLTKREIIQTLAASVRSGSSCSWHSGSSMDSERRGPDLRRVAFTLWSPWSLVGDQQLKAAGPQGILKCPTA